MPSLIATLATASIANGVAFYLTAGVAFVGRWDPGFVALGRACILGVPVLVLWMAAVVLVALFVLKNTRTGFHMVCTGEAEEPARLAGIRVRSMKLLGLTLSGALAGVTAVLLTANLSSAAPTMACGYLAQLGSTVTDTTRTVATLSGGQRQSVAIGRALRWNAGIVVMDEPTAALGVKETAQVLDLIRALNAAGRTVILISHNMADVVAVAHRVAILKQGRKVIDRPAAGLDADTLSHMVMSGRDAA